MGTIADKHWNTLLHILLYLKALSKTDFSFYESKNQIGFENNFAIVIAVIVFFYSLVEANP